MRTEKTAVVRQVSGGFIVTRTTYEYGDKDDPARCTRNHGEEAVTKTGEEAAEQIREFLAE